MAQLHVCEMSCLYSFILDNVNVWTVGWTKQTLCKCLLYDCDIISSHFIFCKPNSRLIDKSPLEESIMKNKYSLQSYTR